MTVNSVYSRRHFHTASPRANSGHYSYIQNIKAVRRGEEKRRHFSELLRLQTYATNTAQRRFKPATRFIPGPDGPAGPAAGAAGASGRTDAAAAPQGAASASQGDVLLRGRSPTPRCAQGQPFCLYDQDYPQERVHDILNTYHDDANTLYHALHRYNPQELINRDNVTHNYRHRGHFACESEVAYLRPGWARNWKDQWVAVVNTDKFPQMVRVETCKFLNQKCEFLPPCYKSSCVQRFAATRLLCVDPANPHQRPIIDVFEMPVACSCFVENFRFL